MIKLFIESMSCEHCVKRISAELEKTERAFTIDLATKTVVIASDENGINKVQTALEEIGYISRVIDNE